jgi:SAM-dependent methyltransferase
MRVESTILELQQWLETPPGQVLLAWERQAFDAAVADTFGFHALQLGLAEIPALRDNRMPHRWIASDWLPLHAPAAFALQPGPEPAGPAPRAAALHCDYDALPFPDASIDLVVLPHTLELARDPHHTLREVERVLRPEGRVMIAGFNPASLWGLRQRTGRARRGIGLGRQQSLYLPRAGDFIGYWRLRDWLRLLSFEVETGRFGCWRPPLNSAQWLDRFAWMDRLGEHWWPVFGAVYFVAAVKRVRGMRLVGLARPERRSTRAASAVVANREPVRRMPSSDA